MHLARTFAKGVLLSLCVLPAAQVAAFIDPLEQVAEISEAALKSRMAAVTRAGERLVAVGPRGHILVSEDKGKSWTQVSVPVSTDLVAVNFISEARGWAVGHDGVVLHSNDGGFTWRKQLDGFMMVELLKKTKEKLSAEDEPSSQKLISRVERLIAEGADKPLFDVRFINEKYGFVVGAFDLAFKTSDGGETWQPFFRTENPYEMHIYGLAESSGSLWFAGERGLVRAFEEEKGAFEEVPSPYEGSFFGIIANKGVLLVFGMRGNAFISHDSGATWARVISPAKGSITSGTVLSDGRYVLATLAGELLVSKDGGLTFEIEETARSEPYYGVVAAGADSVALAGARGMRVVQLR